MDNKITVGNMTGIIANSTITNEVINFLYKSLDLYSLRYEKIDKLTSTFPYITPNYKGVQYFIVFMKITGKSYFVMIEKSKLKFQKNKLDLKKIDLVVIKISNELLKTPVMNGSIFDGKLLNSGQSSTNPWIFLIHDCFYYDNKSLLNCNIIKKFELMKEMEIIKMENCCENFNFKLNVLSKTDDKTVFTIKPYAFDGNIYYPEMSGITALFKNNITNQSKKPVKITNNDGTVDVIKPNSLDLITNYVDFLKNRTYSFEMDGEEKEFYMIKTTIPDVYFLSSKDDSNKEHIAHIPSLKISQMCDELVPPSGAIKFKCVYSQRFSKWTPIAPVLTHV